MKNKKGKEGRVNGREQKKINRFYNNNWIRKRNVAILLSTLFCIENIVGITVVAAEESIPTDQTQQLSEVGAEVEQAQPFGEAADDSWTETYTYLADTQEPHSFFEIVEKNGEQYALKNVQYQVTPLTTQLSKTSNDLWTYAVYEPESEIEENGLKFTFSQLLKEEWIQDGRFQTVTQYRTFLEGQEIPESLDVEITDEVTNETVYGTIIRTDLKEDGADWQENCLEQWEMYSWDGDSWVFELDGEHFDATEESPWFEGCEQILLRDLHLDAAFNQITSVEWYGDGWQDADGNWKRSVRVIGNRVVPRYQAVYSGDIPEADLPMVRYTAQYTSEPQGYLVAATVTYEKEKMQVSGEDTQRDHAETQQFSKWLLEWKQMINTGKLWGILLAALAAIGIGLQMAMIFVLARR